MVGHVVCFSFVSSRRRHTRLQGDWSSDVCSSDLVFICAGPCFRVGWRYDGGTKGSSGSAELPLRRVCSRPPEEGSPGHAVQSVTQTSWHTSKDGPLLSFAQDRFESGIEQMRFFF